MGSSDEQNRMEDKMEVVIGLWACGLLGSYLGFRSMVDDHNNIYKTKYVAKKGHCLLALLVSFFGPITLILGTVFFLLSSNWANKPWKYYRKD